MASNAFKIATFLALFLVLELVSGCAICKSKKSGCDQCCQRPCQTVFIRDNCCCKQPCSETLIVQEDTCSPCCNNPCCQYPCGGGYSYYTYNPCCNPCNPCCNTCKTCCNPCKTCCNPCKTCCNPCNTCNPCNPCCNPCNPCKPCNPCCPSTRVLVRQPECCCCRPTCKQSCVTSCGGV